MSNANDTVIVEITADRHGSNYRGEVCGKPRHIAEQLIAKSHAKLAGVNGDGKPVTKARPLLLSEPNPDAEKKAAALTLENAGLRGEIEKLQAQLKAKKPNE